MGPEPGQYWVVFDPLSQEIDEFLKEWKPLVTPSAHVEWLCVSNHKADQKNSSVDTIGLRAAWNALCIEKGSLVTKQDLERLAIQHNVKTGKWMIYVPNAEVDEKWALIARAIMKGMLGSDAKVSTLTTLKTKKRKRAAGAGKLTGMLKCKVEVSDEVKGEAKATRACDHVICVYSADFSDIVDVFKLRESLMALGFEKKLMYKPDAYSAVGVYHENQWNLSPVAFRG